MKAKNNRQLYFDMQEHPEQYTDAQLESMMDELDSEPDTAQAWQEFLLSEKLRVKSEKFGTTTQQPLHRWLQIAAIMIGVILISGIAYATIHLLHHQKAEQSSQQTVAVREPEPQEEPTVPVHFDDVRLDSILTVVSAHYCKSTFFRSEDAKAMKLIMTWNPDEPLADFIGCLNLFDGLHLSLQHDTIFVETTERKEEDVE